MLSLKSLRRPISEGGQEQLKVSFLQSAAVLSQRSEGRLPALLLERLERPGAAEKALGRNCDS